MKNFKSIILSKRSRDRIPDFMEMLEMRNIIDLQWQMAAMVVAMLPDPRQMSSMYMRTSDLWNMLKRRKQQIPTLPEITSLKQGTKDRLVLYSYCSQFSSPGACPFVWAGRNPIGWILFRQWWLEINCVRVFDNTLKRKRPLKLRSFTHLHCRDGLYSLSGK